MIPRLLWRCPVCQNDDALQQKVRWWKPDLLWCRTCHVTWEVCRFSGGDYWLRVIASDGPLQGQEAPLAQWYDCMKASLKLIPLRDPSLDLDMGEVLWAKSKRVTLFLEVLGKDGLYVSKKRIDVGQLFLTNRRLIWRSPRKVYTLKLRDLIAVWAIEDWRLGIQCRDGSGYRLRFEEESLLKWVTYLGLAARQVEQVCGHKILVSNY